MEGGDGMESVENFLKEVSRGISEAIDTLSFCSQNMTHYAIERDGGRVKRLIARFQEWETTCQESAKKLRTKLDTLNMDLAASEEQRKASLLDKRQVQLELAETKRKLQLQHQSLQKLQESNRKIESIFTNTESEESILSKLRSLNAADDILEQVSTLKKQSAAAELVEARSKELAKEVSRLQDDLASASKELQSLSLKLDEKTAEAARLQKRVEELEAGGGDDWHPTKKTESSTPLSNPIPAPTAVPLMDSGTITPTVDADRPVVRHPSSRDQAKGLRSRGDSFSSDARRLSQTYDASPNARHRVDEFDRVSLVSDASTGYMSRRTAGGGRNAARPRTKRSEVPKEYAPPPVKPEVVATRLAVGALLFALGFGLGSRRR